VLIFYQLIMLAACLFMNVKDRVFIRNTIIMFDQI